MTPSVLVIRLIFLTPMTLAVFGALVVSARSEGGSSGKSAFVALRLGFIAGGGVWFFFSLSHSFVENIGLDILFSALVSAGLGLISAGLAAALWFPVERLLRRG